MHKIFVRWNSDGKGCHKVELTLDTKVIQSRVFMNNEDRLYGYCRGIVETLNRLGISVDMPECLGGRGGKRQVGPNYNRED